MLRKLMGLLDYRADEFGSLTSTVSSISRCADIYDVRPSGSDIVTELLIK